MKQMKYMLNKVNQCYLQTVYTYYSERNLRLESFLYKGNSIMLEPVVPSCELDNLLEQMEGYYMIHENLECIPLGVVFDNNNLICVNNLTGKVYFEDIDLHKSVLVADNLKSFISAISFKKN